MKIDIPQVNSISYTEDAPVARTVLDDVNNCLNIATNISGRLRPLEATLGLPCDQDRPVGPEEPTLPQRLNILIDILSDIEHRVGSTSQGIIG